MGGAPGVIGFWFFAGIGHDSPLGFWLIPLWELRSGYALTPLPKLHPFSLITCPRGKGDGSPPLFELAQRKKSLLLILDDLMGLREDGEFGTEPSAEILLARFRDLHLPGAAKTSSMVFFPTPPGSSWENVTIRFVDGHRVSVKVKSETGVFNYTEMGMASSKNGEPTVQWKLLADFAEEGGVINWRSSKADPNLKKRKSNLARDLCLFFRIEGDPFIYEEKGKGWRARFIITNDK